MKIDFDSSIITYRKLLDIFMVIHDPTQEDGQGEDIGSQYVSVIFVNDEDQRKIAEEVVNELSEEKVKEGKKVHTAVR